MAQKNTLGYFQKSSLRTPEVEPLNIFIGKWINEGYTIKTLETPQLKILTSDVYEWMPGGLFVLHTAYVRIGNMDVGGTEILGYDATTKKYFSHFYDSGGNFHQAVLEGEGNSWIWKGKATGCTSVFTENWKVQTAHHVRLDEHGEWVPSMEVVLTKVH